MRARKPDPFDYLREPKTIGDHLKKKRLDLGLLQIELAKLLGVSEGSIVVWEKNKIFPAIRYIPRIIAFLRYLPFDNILDKPFTEKVLLLRQIRGVSQEELARQLKVDPTTIRRWEGEMRRPYRRVIRMIDSLLTIHIDDMNILRHISAIAPL